MSRAGERFKIIIPIEVRGVEAVCYLIHMLWFSLGAQGLRVSVWATCDGDGLELVLRKPITLVESMRNRPKMHLRFL